MRFSRLGVFVLITTTVFLGTNCSYYNRMMARKNLVDGSNAYKDRKFAEAEQLFRDAVSRDPKGETVEGTNGPAFPGPHTSFRVYRRSRRKGNWPKRPSAEYQKALADNPNDQSSYKAIASLYENLQKTDEWLNMGHEAFERTRAFRRSSGPRLLTSLAAKKNTLC